MKYNSSDWYISAKSGGDPVTLNEIKKHLNLSFETSGSYTFTDDDDYILSLVSLATSLVEGYIGQSIRGNTITATLRNECGGLVLPMCPFSSLTTATDADGNDVSADVNLSGGLFPNVKAPVTDEINVVYDAGWYFIGSNSYGKLPQEIKQAIIEEAAWRYNNRGVEDAGLGCKQAKALLSPYNRKSWLV